MMGASHAELVSVRMSDLGGIMDLLSSIFGRSGFLPHGYCITWIPGLRWFMVGADGVIPVAYFSIPAAILSFVRKRGDPTIGWVAVLFSACQLYQVTPESRTQRVPDRASTL